MKEKDGYAECPEQQLILYVEKEDGKYDTMQTGSFITANYLDDYFFKRNNLEKALQERIDNGEINAIEYYMVLEDLTVSELSSRAGMMKWIVKRHLKPGNFSKLSDSALKKYSVVFNVTVDEIVKRQSENRI